MDGVKKIENSADVINESTVKSFSKPKIKHILSIESRPKTMKYIMGSAKSAKKTRAAVGRWSTMKKNPKLTELRTEASNARTLKMMILRRTLS